MWNQSGVWAQVSNYQRQQRANTDPGFGLATAGRKVIHSFQFVKHLAVASTKMILFMTLNSFMFSQVSLCITRTVENWFIQKIPMIKIPYPARITLKPSFPTPGLGKILVHTFFFSLSFFFSFSLKYTLASLFTQTKNLSTVRVCRASTTFYFYSFLLSPSLHGQIKQLWYPSSTHSCHVHIDMTALIFFLAQSTCFLISQKSYFNVQ